MTLIGAVLLAWAGAIGLLYVTQDQQLYFPTTTLQATPEDAGLSYEDVWLSSKDGLRLHGWYVPAAEAAPVLLFFHGNAGNISHRLSSIRVFHDLGLSVLIIDYRGYGQSEGRPSEPGLYQDAEAAWRYLRDERGVPAQRIVLFGRSLGAAVAARLGVTADSPPGAVILESAFTSAPDLGAELLPWMPVRRLIRVDYDTRAAVEQLRVPILIAHSVEDEVVPFSHGERLFEAAPEPKRFLTMQGGHNDGFLRSQPNYSRALAAFLDHVLVPASSRQWGMDAPTPQRPNAITA